MSDGWTVVAAAAVSALGGGGGAVAWYRARIEKRSIEANATLADANTQLADANAQLIQAQVAETVQKVYGATVAHMANEQVELRTDLTAALEAVDRLEREVKLLRSEKDMSEAHLKDALAVVDQLLVHDLQHDHTDELPAPTIPRTLRALIERETG